MISSQDNCKFKIYHSEDVFIYGPVHARSWMISIPREKKTRNIEKFDL